MLTFYLHERATLDPQTAAGLRGHSLSIHPFAVAFVAESGEVLPVWQQPTHFGDDLVLGEHEISLRADTQEACALYDDLLDGARRRWHTILAVNLHPGNYARNSGDWGRHLVAQMAARADCPLPGLHASGVALPRRPVPGATAARAGHTLLRRDAADAVRPGPIVRRRDGAPRAVAGRDCPPPPCRGRRRGARRCRYRPGCPRRCVRPGACSSGCPGRSSGPPSPRSRR